jgi:hypothetical protein
MIHSVKISPSSGLEGDKILVKGYGYGYNDVDDEGYNVNRLTVDDYATSVPCDV